MGPASRDYDRLVGVYPPGEGAFETDGGRLAAEQRDEDRERREDDHGCSCHINPPCSHCTDCTDCQEATA